MKTLVYEQHELDIVTKQLLEYAKDKADANKATILALTGDLGAGKTTLVQTLAGLLGVSEQITSPTFVVMKRYITNHPVFLELVHIDAYRIEQAHEMEVLGFLEWIKNTQTLICIEWPEKISSLVPADAIPILLEVVDENTRKIFYG